LEKRFGKLIVCMELLSKLRKCGKDQQSVFWPEWCRFGNSWAETDWQRI